MHFLNRTAGRPLAAVLSAWWTAVCGPLGSSHLDANIANDQQFDHTPAAADTQFDRLAQHLPNPLTTDPLQDAVGAIEAGSCLVCVGRVANLPVELYHAMPIHAMLAYGYFASEELPTDQPAGLAKLLNSDSALQRLLNPNATFRGRLPILFWAAKDDIDRFDLTQTAPATYTELRHFLGTDPYPHPTPGLIVRLTDAAVTRHVPTGFDAFDHAHFIPPHLAHPGVQPAPHGVTRNLSQIVPGDGAKEVVTGILRRGQIQFVRIVSNGP